MCRVATTGNANIPFLLLAPPSCNLEHLGEVERHKSHFLVLWQIRKYKRYKYQLRPICVSLPNTQNIGWKSCQISDNSIQSFSIQSNHGLTDQALKGNQGSQFAWEPCETATEATEATQPTTEYFSPHGPNNLKKWCRGVIELETWTGTDWIVQVSLLCILHISFYTGVKLGKSHRTKSRQVSPRVGNVWGHTPFVGMPLLCLLW